MHGCYWLLRNFIRKNIIRWLTTALSAIFSGIIKHSSTVHALERKTSLGHLQHGFSFTYIWRFRPLCEIKSPIVKIFSHPDFMVEMISVMSNRELMSTVCASPQKWRKKMEEICFKAALEKILWAARMRTYIPDEWGHLILIMTFQSRWASIWVVKCLNPAGPAGNPVETFRVQPLKF